MFFGALEPAGERRHVPRGLGGEQPDDRVDVLAPERVDVPLQQLLLRRRRGCSRRCPRSGRGRPSGRARAGARSSRRPWTCRARRRPRRPTSAARRAGSARRAGGRAGAGGRRRTRAGSSPARRPRPRRPGTGSSQAMSWSCSSASPTMASAVPSPAGSGRRGRPSRLVRQTLVAIRYSQVRTDERPSNAAGGRPGAQERLLDQVLGLVHRPGHPVAVREQLALVALRQRREVVELAPVVVVVMAVPVCMQVPTGVDGLTHRDPRALVRRRVRRARGRPAPARPGCAGRAGRRRRRRPRG